MGFFDTLVHLLPRAKAWRVTAAKQLRSFLEGLGASFDAPREFVDDVWADAFPATTRELAEWEKQFGLDATGLNESQRRTQLAAEWAAQGGQDPTYIQETLQAAGFPLYVHEWWDPAEPLYTARDPRLYTTQPLIGTVQCGEALAQCGEPLALCNAFLANEPGYLVNLDLTPRAPPHVPDDPTKWPFFLYVGGQSFPDIITIPAASRGVLERLLLKICPTQQWIVTRVQYDAFSTTSVAFEDLEYVTMGDASELAFDFGDAFSCAGWFKATVGGVLLSKAKTPGDDFFEGYSMFVGSSGKMAVRLEGGLTNNNKIQATTQLGGLLDGEWHHYAFTYDGSSTLAGLTIYVDGAAQAVEDTFDAASNSMLTTDPFTVGRGPGAPGGGVFYSPGHRFDEIAVWSAELTAEQMDAIYNGGIPIDLLALDSADGLVGYWRMGEGATFPTIPDLSGNGNDGTMTNMEAGDIVADAPGL